MSADLLNRLAAAGTPMDLIMEVAETLADARAAQRLLDQRREKDRLRKRLNSVESVETAESAESSETPSPLVPPKVSPGPPSNNPPISPNPEPISAGAKFILPGDIPAEPFAAFVEMRRSIGKKMTDHAKHLAVLKLRKLRDEDGWPPGEVLNHSTLNSYQGLFPPQKDRNNGSKSQSSGVGTTERAMQKALASVEGRGAGASFAG